MQRMMLTRNGCVLAFLAIFCMIQGKSIDDTDKSDKLKETRSLCQDGYTWMCFPVLDRESQGNGKSPYQSEYQPDKDCAFEVIKEILSPNDCTGFSWMNENGRLESIEFCMNPSDPFTPWRNAESVIISTRGYKLGLQNIMHESLQPMSITCTGDPIPENTPITLLPNTSFSPLSPEAESHYNWVGYFRRESTTPWEAFAPVLNFIDEIKGKYWTTLKDPQTGNWFYCGELSQSDECTLNYGDMVMVHCTASVPVSFRYPDVLRSVDARPGIPPSLLNYHEQSNYLPIFVDIGRYFNMNPSPREIGIEIDGICKGAAVIQDSLVMIPAYVIGESRKSSGSDVMFVITDAITGQELRIHQYRVGTFMNRTPVEMALNLNDGEYAHWVFFPYSTEIK
jgi:hypothetical protein